MCSERAQGREGAGQVGLGHLEDALRAGEVGQPVLAEVEELDSGRQLIAEELGRDERGDDLLAVGGVEQAGGAVQRRPEEVAAAALGSAAVERHAHPQRIGPPLADLQGVLGG